MLHTMKTHIIARYPRSLIRILISWRLIFVLSLTPCLVTAQCFPHYKPDTSAPRIRNVIFTTPVSRNNTINGLAIGLQPCRWRGATILNINGLSVSASPTDPIFGFFVLLAAIPESKRSTYPKFDLSSSDLYPTADSAEKSVFNGVVLGSVTPRVKSYGLNISAIMNASVRMNGLSIAGLFNHNYSFKGVSIAGLRNKATKGRGVQIGLLNRCQEGKVVQIGLINKIGKRTIPFINFRF